MPTRSKSSSNQHSPRYSLASNPPYQINYRAKRAGKHISASKRRITFQFGFSSASAIAAGKSEVQCRGEEHEVVLIWSHVTGKRQLFMDGREVHMSKVARGNTKFEYSWQIPGNHVLKMIANGTPPMGDRRQNEVMGIRQFDLQLDGLSYFEFHKIYELGTSGGRGRETPSQREMPAAAYSYRGMAYEARDEEEDDEESLDEAPVQEVKVLQSVDLFDTQPSTSIISPVTANSHNRVPSLICSASSNSMSSFDEFTPVENVSQYRKSFDSISNQIMCQYSAPAAPAPSADTQKSTCTALVPVSEEGMDAITKSMKNLVNLDDITTGPIKPLQANSPTLNGVRRGEAIKWELVGRAPTLAEMRESYNLSPTVPANRQPVMKAPPAPVQGYYQHGQPQQMAYHGSQGYQAAAPAYGMQYGAPQAPRYGYAPAY